MIDVLVAALPSSATEATFLGQVYVAPWKILRGMSALCASDGNKDALVARGAVPALSAVLAAPDLDRQERVRVHGAGVVWQLAFSERGRQAVLAEPGLVEALR